MPERVRGTSDATTSGVIGMLMSMLTPDELDVLRFADTHPWRYPQKQDDVRLELGMHIARYQQALIALSRRQDAEEEFPQLVHRVRRMVDATNQRRARRSALRAV
jgi:hypothetical protein